MTPQFGMYDFFLVVTNRSSGGPKHLVADVYVNRERTNNPDSGWFSFSRSNKIGRLSVYRLYPGCVIRLKGADGQRYEYSSNIVFYMHENTIFLPGHFGGLDVAEIDDISWEELDDEMGCIYLHTRRTAESYFFSLEHAQRADGLVRAVIAHRDLGANTNE